LDKQYKHPFFSNLDAFKEVRNILGDRIDTFLITELGSNFAFDENVSLDYLKEYRHI